MHRESTVKRIYMLAGGLRAPRTVKTDLAIIDAV